MKAYVLTRVELTTIKEELKRLKKERTRIYGKIDRMTADSDDNVDLDLIEGKIAGIEFVLNTIIGKE